MVSRSQTTQEAFLRIRCIKYLQICTKYMQHSFTKVPRVQMDLAHQPDIGQNRVTLFTDPECQHARLAVYYVGRLAALVPTRTYRGIYVHAEHDKSSAQTYKQPIA